MDRLELIKLLHKKKLEKPKKVVLFKSSTPRVRVHRTPDQYKEYRLDISRRSQTRRRESGTCACCSSKAVEIHYVFNGHKIYERFAKYCPRHWEKIELREQFQSAIRQEIDT